MEKRMIARRVLILTLVSGLVVAGLGVTDQYLKGDAIVALDEWGHDTQTTMDNYLIDQVIDDETQNTAQYRELPGFDDAVLAVEAADEKRIIAISSNLDKLVPLTLIHFVFDERMAATSDLPLTANERIEAEIGLAMKTGARTMCGPAWTDTPVTIDNTTKLATTLMPDVEDVQLQRAVGELLVSRRC